MESRYEKIQDWLVHYLAELLDMDPEDIGANTPFTRFGLDSSATIILTSELIEWLEIQIESDDVYQYPTVQSLSKYLAETLYGEQVGP